MNAHDLLRLSAAALRRGGHLWPENLSDEELREERAHHERRPDLHPIALPMLRVEATRRNI